MSAQTVVREPQRYWDDVEWMRQNATELYRKYGIDDAIIWLAIFNKQVLAHGRDLGEVERIAVQKSRKPADEIFTDCLVGVSIIL